MPRLVHRPHDGPTTLVVDDQESALQSTRALLEREGHRIFTCTTGDEALRLLTQHEVHLILVDYCMPAMSGADLIKAIRASDPYVQIILQTGYSGPTPPRTLLAELDIQGYHNKADGPGSLLMWVDVGLRAHALITKLRERERMHAELVANVSHEFRTPLNIIGGYTDMLLDGACGALPDQACGTLRSIADTNRSLGELVDNFLHYARVDAGVVHASSDRVTTKDLVAELHRFGTILVEEKDVTFSITMDDELPAAFVTDSVKLRTILRNTIVNAAKFTTAGEVCVSITSTAETLTFHVRDTGPGIPADQLAAVFEPFRQLDGSSTRRHGGVGLGLALSRRLASLLGGTLALTSRVGVGSIFTLTIPRRDAQALPSAAASTMRATSSAG